MAKVRTNISIDADLLKWAQDYTEKKKRMSLSGFLTQYLLSVKEQEEKEANASLGYVQRG